MTRVWRSRTVAWVAALLVFALVAAACANREDAEPEQTTAAPVTTAAPETTTTAPPATTTTAPPQTTTTEPAGPQYGGEVVFGHDQEPATLNPLVPGGNNPTVWTAAQQYLAGAYDIDGFTLELIPDLLTELPTLDNGGVILNEDGTMTVNYQIREEAVWSDGVPVSGEDFLFTLDLHLDPELPVDDTLYEDVIATEVGPKTFSFTLAAPTVQYELMFDYVVPKHDVEGSDFVSDWNDEPWVSAGPFVFESWIKGESLTVVRNENYWKTDAEGNQLPYLDRVTTRFIPGTAALIDAFRAREVDVINPPPDTAAIDALEESEFEGAVVEVLKGTTWEHLNFQFGPGRFERNENSPNESLAYRKAVAHLIDKELIVDEILDGQVEPLDSFVEAYIPQLSAGAWAQYDYDVEKAVALVEEAKAELGVDTITTVFSTTSNSDARVQLAILLEDMFAAAGIEYDTELEDSQLFFGETLDDGMWDLGEWAWVGSPGFSGVIEIMDVFDPQSPPPEGSNYYRWGSPDSVLVDESTQRLAEIRDLINTSVDSAVLEPLLAEAEQILADQVVIIPLFSRLDAAAFWADEIGGFKHNASDAGLMWNIEEWYRLDQ